MTTQGGAGASLVTGRCVPQRGGGGRQGRRDDTANRRRQRVTCIWLRGEVLVMAVPTAASGADANRYVPVVVQHQQERLLPARPATDRLPDRAAAPPSPAPPPTPRSLPAAP